MTQRQLDAESDQHNAEFPAVNARPLPPKLPTGNYDAIAYACANLARKLIRDRRTAGLSQAELARRAGIRVETLNRIEKLKLTPTIATVGKIDRELANE